MGQLDGKRVLLGVTGGIAVYKAVELLRLLVKAGADVHVAMTPAATEFVQPLTFRELSYHPVAVDVFEEPREWKMQHIHLAECDLVVIAPATANTLAKLAVGIADNSVTTTVLATQAPIVVAPAMNSGMWENPITQENIARLRQRGYHVVGPDSGFLACRTSGAGRMSSPEDIFAAVVEVLTRQQDWQGLQLLVTAGPTREHVDPVRYIGNRSSGKMGYAIAAAAARRGADVTLVSGPTALTPPSGVRLVKVWTTQEMRDACVKVFPKVDACIKAAAPADFRVAEPSDQKVKKEAQAELVLRLVPNPDILAELGEMKQKQVLVGFAAESQDLIKNAQEKMRRKRCDLLVANDITMPGAGFDVDTNKVKLLYPNNQVEDVELMDKSRLADLLLDRVLLLIKAR
ncbi:MAG TPA: bifunctional phosphopantothenoylcysteine decarboxylase/phosphopantothenate--cysteine ligase CoaBC [Firmicutes bacterium]|nr:bifunctional phosphopantothenoylcysteine decarboxylase/phosphopantothenate--cysteine ligase CoaBC [Bacillota bacterium]